MKQATRRFVVRNLKPGDQLDHELLGNWAALKLDHDWVWVVEHHANIEAIMIAAPMHGLVFLLRIAATKYAPDGWLLCALRTVLKESQRRGLIAAMTYLTTAPTEQKLMRLALRAGWLVQPETGVWLIGSTETKY